MWTRGAQLLLALVALSAAGRAAQGSSVPLDGTWDLLFDHEQRGLAQGLSDPDHPRWNAALRVTVPGAWESLPEGAGYDGVAWYRRRVPELPETGAADERLLLEFQGINAHADVWVDGQLLFTQTGSDVPFQVDVSNGALDRGSRIVLRVVDPGPQPTDGLLLGALPHAKEDWYFNYGGVTGSVSLRRVAPVELVFPELVAPLSEGAPGSLRVALINRDSSPRSVGLAAVLAHDGPLSAPTPDAANVSSDDHVGRALLLAPPGRSEHVLNLPVDAKLRWWSPAEPVLHSLRLELHLGERVIAQQHSVGLRRFEVEQGRFRLNGEPFRPWGVLWQPLFPAGLATPPDNTFLRRELVAIRAAGFSLVRAHLRTVPQLYELCDELGLLVHAEPTLGWITSLGEQTLPATRASIDAFADAVRGHPSVVLVGLLNELSGELQHHTDALFDQLCTALPAHLAIDDSGGWQGRARHRGPAPAATRAFDDEHIYRPWPWTADDFAHVAGLGGDHDDLIYISEYGFGGVPSLSRALAGHGSALWREDATLVLQDLNALRQAVASEPLRQIASDPDTVSALGQHNQARAARLMTAALLSNARVAGGVYTQWRDVSWECGAGLVDHWGNPKPALAALSQLLAAERPPTPRELRPPPPAPRAARPLAVGAQVAVQGRAAQVISGLVAPHDKNLHGLPRLTVVGHRTNPWGKDEQPLTVALLRHVLAGGVLLMLEPPDAGRPLPHFFFGYDGTGQVTDLPFDLAARPARGHFVGTHFAFRAGSRLLDDLPMPAPLLDERFGAAKPHVVLATGPAVQSQVELLCVDGYGLPVGAAVQSVRLGRGRLVLSTLRFDDESLSDPAVERLLENLVRFAVSEAISLPAPLDVLPSAPPADLADAISRSLWRTKIAFGLLERLAVQTENGMRPARSPQPDEALLVERKNSGLMRVLNGKAQQGADVLALITQSGLDPVRESFLRQEIELSKAFFDTGVPRDLRSTLETGRAHALALRLMAAGQHAEAMAQMERALAGVQALPR